MRAARLPQSPRHLDIEQFEVRPAFHVDASPAAVDIGDAPGEQNYRTGAGVAVTPAGRAHKCAFQLQQGAVELSLPGGLEKRGCTDEIGRLGVDLDVELVDLRADHDVDLRALEFRPGDEHVPVGDNRCGRCRVTQDRCAADQREGVEVGHHELFAAVEQRDQGWRSGLHGRTEMKVSFLSCHS
jgi:hypothetical protein